MYKLIIAACLSVFTMETSHAGYFSRLFGKSEPISCPQLFIPESSLPVIEAARRSILALEPLTPRPPMAVDEALLRIQDYLETVQSSRASVIGRYLLPYARNPSLELTISVVGMDSVNKSSVFDSLTNYADAPDGATLLRLAHSSEIATPPAFLLSAQTFSNRKKMENRFGPLATTSFRAESDPNLSPVYAIQNFLPNLIFVDIPPFDTQKVIADQTVLWSDVVMLVFSAENINNENNKKYLFDLYKKIGGRKTILVYKSAQGGSESEALIHIKDVANTIYPNSTPDFSKEILGAYIIPRKPESKTPDDLVPTANSPTFDALLVDLNHRAPSLRSQALQESLRLVIQDAADHVRGIQKDNEEVDLYRESLSILLMDTVKKVIGTFPHHTLAKELETTWFGRLSLRNFGRWIGRPVRQLFGLGSSDLFLTGPGMYEIKKYVEAVVDQVITQFQIALAQGKITVNTSTANFKRLEIWVREYRSWYKITGTAPPFIQRSAFTDEAVVVLADSQKLQEQLGEYSRQDWDALREAVKISVMLSFAEATSVLQREFRDATKARLRERPFLSRTASVVYPLMTFVPTIAALTYVVVENGQNFTDIQSILALAGAVTAGRMFAILDERNLRNQWNQIIDEWYGNYQLPRLTQILQHYLIFNIYPKIKINDPQIQRIEAAIETLSAPRGF